MIKYLLQILENNNRVIIPEFGAFIIKHREPLTIVFNEFLQYNDGQLIDVISREEKINKEHSKQKLDEFIQTINESLNKGEPFSLGQLGVLTKSATGRISIEEPGSIDQPGTAKEKLKSGSEIKIEPTTFVGKENIPPTKKEKLETDIKAKQKTDKPQSKVEKAVHTEPVKSKPKSIQTETVPEIVYRDPIQKKEDDPKFIDDVTRTNGKKINVIAWIVIILIVNGIIIAYFLTSENLSNLFLKERSKTEIVPIAKPSATKKTSPGPTEGKTSEQVMASIEDSIKKIVLERTPAKANVINGKRYYIVAGVFSNEQNANKLVRELKRKGYNSENFGKIGSLFAVSYDVRTSKEEADILLSKIKKEFDTKAWIKVKE